MVCVAGATVVACRAGRHPARGERGRVLGVGCDCARQARHITYTSILTSHFQDLTWFIPPYGANEAEVLQELKRNPAYFVS